MVRAVMVWLAVVFAALGVFTPSYAIKQSPENVSADVIRNGCSVSFLSRYHPIPDDPLSNAPFDVLATWSCRDGEKLSIDRYGINGANPEIATVFFWKRDTIVILVRWPQNSQVADYVGDYYKVFIYQYKKKENGRGIVRNDGAMGAFPAGWDGREKNGNRVIYPYKNAASIRKRLSSVRVD